MRGKCFDRVIDRLTYDCDGEVKLRRMGEISHVYWGLCRVIKNYGIMMNCAY